MLLERHDVFSMPVTAGFIWNLQSAGEWSGTSVTGTIPGKLFPLLVGSFGKTNKAWGAMSQLAKNETNIQWRDWVAQFSLSGSGPGAIKFGLRQNSFTFEGGISSDPIGVNSLGEGFGGWLAGTGLVEKMRSFKYSLSSIQGLIQ